MRVVRYVRVVCVSCGDSRHLNAIVKLGVVEPEDFGLLRITTNHLIAVGIRTLLARQVIAKSGGNNAVSQTRYVCGDGTARHTRTTPHALGVYCVLCTHTGCRSRARPRASPSSRSSASTWVVASRVMTDDAFLLVVVNSWYASIAHTMLDTPLCA